MTKPACQPRFLPRNKPEDRKQSENQLNQKAAERAEASPPRPRPRLPTRSFSTHPAISRDLSSYRTQDRIRCREPRIYCNPPRNDSQCHESTLVCSETEYQVAGPSAHGCNNPATFKTCLRHLRRAAHRVCYPVSLHRKGRAAGAGPSRGSRGLGVRNLALKYLIGTRRPVS